MMSALSLCLSVSLAVSPAQPTAPSLSLSALHSRVHHFFAAASADLHCASRFLQRCSARLPGSLLSSHGKGTSWLLPCSLPCSLLTARGSWGLWGPGRGRGSCWSLCIGQDLSGAGRLFGCIHFSGGDNRIS